MKIQYARVAGIGMLVHLEVLPKQTGKHLANTDSVKAPHNDIL
jgi:hypothetical protein